MKKVLFIMFFLSVIFLTGCWKKDYESLVSSNNEIEQKVETEAKTNNQPIDIKEKSEISLVNKDWDETVYVSLDLWKYGKRYLETQHYETVTPWSKYLAWGGSVDDIGSVYYLPAEDKVILTLDNGWRNQGCRSIQAFLLDIKKKNGNPHKIDAYLPREFSFIDNDILVWEVCYEGESLYGDMASIATYYTTWYYDISTNKSYSEAEYNAKEKKEVTVNYNWDNETNKKFIREYYNLLKNNQLYDARKLSLWEKWQKDFETFNWWYKDLEDVKIIDAIPLSGNKYKIIVDTWYKNEYSRVEWEKEVVYSGDNMYLKTNFSYPITSKYFYLSQWLRLSEDSFWMDIDQCKENSDDNQCRMLENTSELRRIIENNLDISNYKKVICDTNINRDMNYSTVEECNLFNASKWFLKLISMNFDEKSIYRYLEYHTIEEWEYIWYEFDISWENEFKKTLSSFQKMTPEMFENIIKK